jgi:hypothetical protein
MLGFYRKPRHEVETACRGCLSRRLAGLALVGLVGLLPSAASGEVLLFAANAGEQTFTGTDARLADLNGSAAGGTSLSFTTS